MWLHSKISEITSPTWGSGQTPSRGYVIWVLILIVFLHFGVIWQLNYHMWVVPFVKPLTQAIQWRSLVWYQPSSTVDFNVIKTFLQQRFSHLPRLVQNLHLFVSNKHSSCERLHGPRSRPMDRFVCSEKTQIDEPFLGYEESNTTWT